MIISIFQKASKTFKQCSHSSLFKAFSVDRQSENGSLHQRRRTSQVLQEADWSSSWNLCDVQRWSLENKQASWVKPISLGYSFRYNL